MQLEDYLDFLSPDDIRIKGHRIGIDHVIDYYLKGYSPEEIVANLSTLSLEKVYATITYYLHNRAEVDAYLWRLAKWREQHYQEWTANPSPVVQRIIAVKARRAKERDNSL